jgi:hypothetical protein
MVSKVDFKNLFQSSLKDMLNKKENKQIRKTWMFFEKLMEGKHTYILSNGDDDLTAKSRAKVVLFTPFLLKW